MMEFDMMCLRWAYSSLIGRSPEFYCYLFLMIAKIICFIDGGEFGLGCDGVVSVSPSIVSK